MNDDDGSPFTFHIMHSSTPDTVIHTVLLLTDAADSTSTIVQTNGVDYWRSSELPWPIDMKTADKDHALVGPGRVEVAWIIVCWHRGSGSHDREIRG